MCSSDLAQPVMQKATAENAVTPDQTQPEVEPKLMEFLESDSLDLTGKRMMNYIGNYDYYLEKHEAMMNAHFGTENVEPTGGIVGFGASKTGAAAETSGKAAESSADAGGKLDWKAQKEEQARQRKRQNDLKKVEDEIHRLETRDGEIDGLLCDESVFSDVAKLMELNKEKEEIAGKLETLYEKWEELAE